MASVLDVLKLSGGSLPLNELMTRTSDSPREVAVTLQSLRTRGVVKVRGPMPDDAASMEQSADTTVEIADLGALLR